MTPARKPTQKESFFSKVLPTVSAAAIIGTFVFLWRVNDQIVDIKAADKAREEKVMEIKKGVDRIEEDVKGIKEDDLQDVKDRLKTLEIKNEKDK